MAPKSGTPVLEAKEEPQGTQDELTQMEQITAALEKAAEFKENKLERALEQFGARFEALETKLDAINAKLIMAECTAARHQASSSGSAVGTRVGSSLGSGEYLMPDAMPDAASA